MIRSATQSDATAICSIYNHHVLNTVVTFEEEPVNMATMQQRIADVSQQYPWIVYTEEELVLAYAYATTWKTRSAYRFTVESTIYVAEGNTGKGIGRMLYTALLDRLKAAGIHSVIGGIALPNPASIHLHEALGFEYIGQFKEVGQKFGKWVNVGYWELIFK